VTLTKADLTQTLGIQLRDLRLLDPLLVTSYPSAILCRERSLVVNLEYIKMIVGLERCYITNLDDDSAQAFVSELKKRLEHQYSVRMAKEKSSGVADLFGSVVGVTAAERTGRLGVMDASIQREGSREVARQRSPILGSEDSRTPLVAAAGLPPLQWQDPALQQQDGPLAMGPRGSNERQTNQLEDLPFELRVLEAALDIVLKYMETMTSDLEASAHPALDALTTKVDTENLERVRRVKNRMVRLTTRVETLREVLEKFLDDDADMRDMNLTAKEAREEQERIQDLLKHSTQNPSFDTLGGAADIKPPDTPHSALTYDSDEEEEEAIEVVEQLLETYFMQADNTWNKLQTLTEYIDDTEDYVNIQLDSQRNQLIRLDLILTCLSASIALITAITSLFAMNVQLRPGSEDDGPYSWFVVISTTSCAGAILLFLGVMTYSRYKRLI
jgi:magnesium transporter